MLIGFTGTREGMSDVQKALFVGRLAMLCYAPEEFHHGDDAGADREAHDLVRLHWPKCIIIAHAPSNPAHRAYCKADAILDPRPYLERNKAIVACCQELIAAPLSMVEQFEGSGTWATIRYARAAGKPVHMLMR